MGWFKSKYERELDLILDRIEMNMSNNYKDAAQENLKKFEETLESFAAEGRLKEKSLASYRSQLETYRCRLKGYTHKDQKPYWT